MTIAKEPDFPIAIEYFWFGPYNFEFVGFRLQNGVYQPIEPNAQGYLWSEELGLYLGLHEERLRYFTPEGELVPSLRGEIYTGRCDEKTS